MLQSYVFASFSCGHQELDFNGPEFLMSFLALQYNYQEVLGSFNCK